MAAHSEPQEGEKRLNKGETVKSEDRTLLESSLRAKWRATDVAFQMEDLLLIPRTSLPSTIATINTESSSVALKCEWLRVPWVRPRSSPADEISGNRTSRTEKKTQARNPC
jgi:hypothetical protein